MAELSPLTINDPIYGSETITEPVLLDIITSHTLQRLKGISQLGLPHELHFLKTFSRYDHSLGTLIVTRRLDGDLRQQIKAVTHDVSHTPFSHLIDWVRGSQDRDDYQDSIHAQFLRESDIAGILTRYSFDVEEFTTDHGFPIVEQDAPRICADRVDYALREMLISGFAPNIVPICVEGLTTFEGRIVFKDSRAARLFGWGYRELHIGDWGARESLGRFMLFARLLKDALNDQVIEWSDFKEDDNFVMNKLRARGDKRLITRLKALGRPLDENPELELIKGESVKKKYRYVDPEFLAGGRLVKLTEVNGQYAKTLEEEREIAQQAYVIT